MKLRNLLFPALAACCTTLFAQAPEASAPDRSGHILTPPAPATPRINSARVFGVRPGAPLLYTIAATGERPMVFAAEGLPEGVALDPQTGRITGKLNSAGSYRVTLRATNARGTTERDLRIVAGDAIALTPPMGWSSWNCWGHSVSQEKVLGSARALVEKGLADYGWTYVNIDDGWQGRRGGAENAIQPNDKFPDMKALAEEVHGLGLKLGIYSAPWVGTYAGHVGSYSDRADGKYDWLENGECDEVCRYRKPDATESPAHKVNFRHGAYSWVAADARQWAAWGVDYLKYDWYPNNEFHAREMADALRQTGRDIVFSMSNSAPFADAPRWAGIAQSWRTTGDIYDTWESILYIGFERQERWAAFHGPGHWADADMLVVGMVGWGPELHPTGLTPDEQYAHITLWTLLASPMLIGCDIARMDDFTRSLLCNFEVNDILQDPLGMRAVRFGREKEQAVFVKILEDGSLAIGLFNLSDEPRRIGFEPFELGLWSKSINVRDVWRQQDAAEISCHERYETEVAPHGAALYRLTPGNIRERAGEKL